MPDGTVSDLSNPTNLAALHANWDLIDAEEVSQIDMTNSLHLAPLAYLALGGDTNLLVQIYQTSGTLETNVFSGAMLTNTITSVTLVTNGIPFELAVTNLIATGSVLPLPMPPMLGATIDVLFGILLAPELSLDTSEELYDFLMLRPSAFDRWWDFLGSYFARYPFIQQTIMPVVSRPRTDNLYNEDRIALPTIGPFQTSSGKMTMGNRSPRFTTGISTLVKTPSRLRIKSTVSGRTSPSIRVKPSLSHHYGREN